jgi:hypothetical protein
MRPQRGPSTPSPQMSDETLHRMLENIENIENGGVGDLEEGVELLKGEFTIDEICNNSLYRRTLH